VTNDDAAVAPAAETTGLSLPRRGVLALRLGLGLLVGFALVLVFLRLVRFSAVTHQLDHLNIAIALACGAVFLSAYVVRGLRWRRFLGTDQVPRRHAVPIYVIAVFLNWLLPIQGGELAKSLMLRRTDGMAVSTSLPATAVDKAMDLLPAVVLVAVVPFTGLHLSRTLWVLLLLASVAIGAGVCVTALAAWRRGPTLSALRRLLGFVLPSRVMDKVEPFVEEFSDHLLSLVRRPRLLLIAAGYTVVAASMDALFCFLAFRAVGASVAFPVVLFGYTLYNLAYILPTPPAHLGSNEVVGVLIFSGVFGVSRTSVGAMFLFSHPWTAILLTTSGLICLRFIGLNIRSALKLGPHEQPSAVAAPVDDEPAGAVAAPVDDEPASAITAAVDDDSGAAPIASPPGRVLALHASPAHAALPTEGTGT
jgi:uncharacterized protein (TIRG00374 family)